MDNLFRSKEKKYRKMRWHKILVLTLLFSPLFSLSNSADFESKRQEIDSLLAILPGSGDSNRAEIFLNLSRIYLSISMDSSIEYARQAMNSAKIGSNNRQIAEAYKLLGNASYYKAEYDQVINYYDSSLAAYKLANDSFGQAKVLNNLGIVYHYIGDFRTSIEYYLKSLDFKSSLNDSIGIANTNNNIGSIYYDLGEYASSYDYFRKALTISERLGNDNSTQSILNNMGLISQELGQHQKAVELFNKSIEYGEKTSDVIGIADTYHNLGKSKVMLGKYLEGLEFYNKALAIYRELGVSESHTLNNIGQAYIELDYYYQALKYLRKALNDAGEKNQFKVMRDIYQNLSVAYERMGDFEKAYYNYMKFNEFDDSLRSQSYLTKIEKISTKHEIEKSHEQIEKAKLALEKKEADIRRRNFVIYSTIAGFLAALVFVIVLYRMGVQKQKVNIELMHQNDEVLRSQTIIKKINKALSENEEKLRSIFDVSPYSILVLDSGNKIADCNDTSLELFSVKNSSELLDRSIETLVAGQEKPDEKHEVLDYIRKNELNRSQFTLARMDGSTFEAELTGRVIRNPQGEIDSYIVVINDITERLHFVESLKEAKLNAEESDRLKTAFLANMSHEIRTPMNSIVGFSNLLNDPKLKSDKKQEFLQHILQSSSLLLNLIDDIIDISKIEAGQMNISVQQFKVNEVVKEIFASFKESNVNEKLKFRLVIPRGTDDLLCNTDPLRLRQVLTNLLSNAVKFTPEGSIELGYKLDPQKSRPRIEFYLKDTGIGIPENKLDLIFERFRQVDDSQSRQYGGTGLGLAISKRLVELIGGTIWVESEKGKGSTFYFTIPYVLPEPDEFTTQQFDSKKYNWKGKSILIAEDENSNFELIKAAISNTRINVLRANNGEEAVDYVHSGEPVDLILMDIRMPVMNGYDATREIKSINKKIPIVAITAYAMSEDEAKSIKAGCDKYVSKPIRPVKLLEMINELIS
jgi:PAS domain S-box-containing protein